MGVVNIIMYSYNDKLEKEYNKKYGDIPRDYNDRINYMIRKYNISPHMMDKIISKKRNMEFNMRFYEYMVIDYSIPRVKHRPRMRIINRKNYMDYAKINPNMVQVYSPHAKDDMLSMKRLIGDELEALHIFIQTPCMLYINAYEKTPETFSIVDKVLAEYGLILNTGSSDYDNILKSTSDRLNTTLWLDDSLVISGTINKWYSILPREEIYIKYLNTTTNKHQYKAITNRKGYNDDYPISYIDSIGNIIH